MAKNMVGYWRYSGKRSLNITFVESDSLEHTLHSRQFFLPPYFRLNLRRFSLKFLLKLSLAERGFLSSTHTFINPKRLR